MTSVLRLPLALAMIASSALLACAKSTPEPPQAGATAAAPTPSASAAATMPSVAASGLPAAYASIAERFAYEAQHRPSDTPRAEDVYAAFEKSGTKIAEKSQHAAGVYGAQFCMGAKAQDDLHMSVCEFATAADIETGKALSDKMFGTVPDRANYVRKHTLLILRQAVKTPASEARAKKLVDLFSKL